jgi:hypothetical protein
MGPAHNEICRPFFRSDDNQLASRSSHSRYELGFRGQSFFMGEGFSAHQNTASRLAKSHDDFIIGGAIELR